MTEMTCEVLSAFSAATILNVNFFASTTVPLSSRSPPLPLPSWDTSLLVGKGLLPPLPQGPGTLVLKNI